MRCEEILRIWTKQSQGDGRWDDLQMVLDEKKTDYFAVLNYPFPGAWIEPRRAIIFPMEPMHNRRDWGAWRNPSPAKILRVMSYDRHYHNLQWHLSRTYSELMEQPVEKSLVFSSVTSDLVEFEGQRKRVQLLKTLSQSGIPYDLFGRGNRCQIPNYRGALPPPNKRCRTIPPPIHFRRRKLQEYNYFTEKLVDAILAECLCFYWGCPNVSDYIAPRAFIPVDLDRPQEAIEVIRTAIAQNEWEKRIGFVRAEKRKILTRLQFFPRLHRLLHSLG